MREWTISRFLEQLASRQPAPGGGAASALQLAQAAALVGMVARCSQGPKYEVHEALVSRVVGEADALRDQAVQIAEDDADAFGGVADATRLPKDTPERQVARTEAIATALLVAAKPPAAVITTADQVVALAEELLPAANPNALADLSAATQSARAATVTARLNLDTNLSGARDPAPAHVAAAAAHSDDIISRADQVSAAVGRKVTG